MLPVAAARNKPPAKVEVVGLVGGSEARIVTEASGMADIYELSRPGIRPAFIVHEIVVAYNGLALGSS
jgi:hypothetical protein